MNPVTLPQDKPVLRVMPMPTDANIHGDVFGGWIMAQVDIAGAIPAARRANGRVATIAVTSFLFKNPVFVGDLLSFHARVIKTGTTSVTVEVEVYAERMRLETEVVKVTEATLAKANRLGRWPDRCRRVSRPSPAALRSTPPPPTAASRRPAAPPGSAPGAGRGRPGPARAAPAG